MPGAFARKFLPFKYAAERFLETAEKDIFLLHMPDGKRYVLKEPDRFYRVNIPCPPLELAQKLRTSYEIIKEHYGDVIVDTHFLVAAGRRGKPCVIVVQPYINGVRCSRLPAGERESAYEAVYANVRDQAFSGDTRWDSLDHDDRSLLAGRDIGPENIIKMPDGKLKIVDW